MSYDLWYWTGIQGRGEFVRVPLEAAGIPYRDRAREDGDKALAKDMKARAPHAPFAPPYLIVDGVAVAQVANILQLLGERHPLAPADPVERRWLHQVQLTLTDFVAEVHQVHHPVGIGLYYEDQKAEAARFAEEFRQDRMPKFLGWLEGAVRGEWLMGEAWSYGDTSIFLIVDGLRYMFPRRMETLAPTIPALIRIHDAVVALPGVAAYLASDRRLPPNTDGIFRHYPELDGE
jgi:glutathione S-transferase